MVGHEMVAGMGRSAAMAIHRLSRGGNGCRPILSSANASSNSTSYCFDETNGYCEDGRTGDAHAISGGVIVVLVSGLYSIFPSSSRDTPSRTSACLGNRSLVWSERIAPERLWGAI